MSSVVANKWKSVQGETHWKGLLDPLDEELCAQVIRYGQFVQTVYDAFNSNQYSNAFGFSRYGKSELFDKLHVKSGYNISKYIYCSTTLESLLGKLVDVIYPFSGPTTSWFGYIAVSDDAETQRIGRRDIVVAFRGTMEDVEWASNILNSFQAGISTDPKAEPMSSLIPLDVREEDLVLATPPAAAAAAQVKSTAATKTVRVATTGVGKLVGGIAGGLVSTVSVVTETVVGTVASVANLLPWQKALIGNRWLVPYTGANKKEEHGFGKSSARMQIMEAITELINRYKDEEISITVTGHSLGAAIATVCAYDIVNEKKNVNPETGATIPVTAFTFASPRVGNLEFKAAAEKLSERGLNILRISNLPDLVPNVPPLLFGYVHTGVDFLLNSAASKYIKFPTLNLADPHNLQLHLHLIANKFGSLKYHALELVNKYSDSLKDPIVPANWWVVENTDVFFNVEQGKWELRKYDISSDNEEFN